MRRSSDHSDNDDASSESDKVPTPPTRFKIRIKRKTFFLAIYVYIKKVKTLECWVSRAVGLKGGT